MSGGVPANTSTTTTVNQSPWQNQTYRTLALGTPGNLGPVAQQLKIGQQLTQDWMDIQSGRNPGLYYGLPNATPQELALAKAGQDVGFAAGRAPAPAPADTETKAAAQGGIMSLRNFVSGGSANATVNPQGYAAGGAAKPKYNAKSSADDKLTALNDAVKNGYKPKPAEVTFMQGMADTAAVRQQLGDTPYTVDPKTGALKPIARGSSQTSGDYTAYLNKLGGAGVAVDPKLVKQYGAQTSAQIQQAAADKQTAANRPYSYSDLATPTAFLDPKTGQNMLGDAQLAYQKARELGNPEQIQQATAAYNAAIQGLQGMANYTPQQVQASSVDRGGVRDVSAQQARVERMRGGPNVQAIQAQANQMEQPEDVTGQTYQATNIAPTQREQAQQIGDIGSITGQGYSAAQMSPVAREAGVTTTAPKTWTDPGVAQQYMNPYAQAVINQNVQEANRNFQKNLSALRGQAAKSKAYGGSRQGLEESEALRNQGYLLADIQDKGLSQAYTQGMGQFQAEQGLGSQVGMSNTAQINQLKSQYMQMGMTEAQANQAAINQAAQFSASQGQSAQAQNVANQLARQQSNAQMVNQLKSQYMSMGLTEAQANQAAQNQAAQFGAQSAQQAALANQQAGLTTGQANLSAAQQTALANQQVGMTAQQLNQLYGQGGFQTQAANQAAQNQAYNNYVAQMLAAQQGNQQIDYNTLLQNAQLAQQAAVANQQAGLQANQQNIGAYSAMGNMAQGLGGLGATQSQIGLNNLAALGQSATAQTQYAQGALDRNTQNAMNWYNLPTTFNAAGINALNAQPVSGGSNASSTNYGQAKWFNKGGKVQWGPKK